MSDDDATPLVRRLRAPHPLTPGSPLTSVDRAPLAATSALYGEKRGMYRPTMALQTITRLGPVRHALAQRAIAGMIEVHAPFSPPPKK
jgi:hypothetical protein